MEKGQMSIKKLLSENYFWHTQHRHSVRQMVDIVFPSEGGGRMCERKSEEIAYTETATVVAEEVLAYSYRRSVRYREKERTSSPEPEHRVESRAAPSLDRRR
jgi:hypothetical protein